MKTYNIQPKEAEILNQCMHFAHILNMTLLPQTIQTTTKFEYSLIKISGVHYKPFLAAMILDNPANHFFLPQQTAASEEQHFSS